MTSVHTTATVKQTLGPAIVPSRENCCVVIVTYHPGNDFSERISRLAALGDKIVCVDNGSPAPEISTIAEALLETGGTLIRNDENLGLATALNQGLNRAREDGYVWALMLDQDTEPFPEILDTLAAIFDAYPEREKIAVIGSNYLVGGTRQDTVRFRHGADLWRETHTVITAGSLLSLPLREIVGTMRDSFFIDHVDHEYCLRARSHGLKVIISDAPLMRQPIGAVRFHRILGGFGLGASNHSANRRYYMIRNYVGLVREYLFKEPVFLMANLKVQMLLLLGVVLFESDKVEKLSMALRGLRDGIFGKTGKYRRSG